MTFNFFLLFFFVPLVLTQQYYGNYPYYNGYNPSYSEYYYSNYPSYGRSSSPYTYNSQPYYQQQQQYYPYTSYYSSYPSYSSYYFLPVVPRRTSGHSDRYGGNAGFDWSCFPNRC